MSPMECQGPSVPGAFAEIVALARRMGEAARAGDWEAVTDLEASRRARIAEYFAAAEGADDAAAVAAGIEALLAIDRDVMELARARMGALGAELNALQTGRRVVQAYAAAGQGRP